MVSVQYYIEIRQTDEDADHRYQLTKSELKHCFQIIGFQQNDWLIEKAIQLYQENGRTPLSLQTLQKELHLFAEKPIFQKKLKHLKLGCDLASQ